MAPSVQNMDFYAQLSGNVWRLHRRWEKYAIIGGFQACPYLYSSTNIIFVPCFSVRSHKTIQFIRVNKTCISPTVTWAPQRMRRWPRTMKAGQAQLLAVSAAFCFVIMMFNITVELLSVRSLLDPQTTRDIIAMLQHAHQNGKTIVLATPRTICILSRKSPM